VRRVAWPLVAFLIALPVAAQPTPAPSDLLARVGQYVQNYFTAARTIVSRETLRLQRVDSLMAPLQDARILVFELRVESAPSALPSMTRRLLKDSGHVAPYRSEDRCFDPPDVTIDPLAMLLPERQQEFAFTIRRGSRGGVVEVDYAPVERRDPVVTWNDPCISIDVNGSTRGRIWVEAATGVVVRADERLDKPFEYLLAPTASGSRQPVAQTLDRLETSVRYEPVKFRDPDETLVLPKSARTVAFIYNSGVPRLVTIQSFDKYQRFVTGGRIVK